MEFINVKASNNTRGAYDLFIFFLAPDPTTAENMIYNLRLDPTLINCPAHWYASYFTVGMGYVPLRDSFFGIVEKQVWHRSKEQPRKGKSQIFIREFGTLKELNSNGLVEFSKIDEKYGLNKGAANYTYYKLIEEKMINRVTITMGKPPIKDVAIMLIKQKDLLKFQKKRKEWLLDVITEGNTPLNKYILSGDVGSPYGILRTLPIYQNGDLEKIENTISKMIKGAEIKTSMLSEILTGRLGFRKIDIKETWLYQTFVKEYRYEP